MTTFTIRVRPGASRARVGGTHDGALIVAVHAQPVDGKANEAVVRALADAFDVPRSSVSVIRGHTARTKTIEIDANVDERLAELLSQ